MTHRRPMFAEDAAWDRCLRVLAGWIGTPYRHCCKVRGRGVDCSLFIAGVLEDLGVVTDIPYEYYPRDWMHHQKIERVIDAIHERVITRLLPGYDISEYEPGSAPALMRGDILTFSLVRQAVTNHCAILTGSGEMVHAINSRGVLAMPFNTYWKNRITRIFRIMSD